MLNMQIIGDIYGGKPKNYTKNGESLFPQYYL